MKTRQLISSPSFIWWLRTIFLPFLITRMFLLLVGYCTWILLAPSFAGASYLPGHSSLLAFSWEVWRWFDSFWYLGIVEHGYAPGSALHQPTNWVFYPLYPLGISIVGWFFGSTPTSYLAAGLLISNGSALVALSYLYLLVEQDFDRHIAQRTLFLLLAYPTAFYLSAVYTESPWLALAVACLYYARKRRWKLAGCLGAIAAATRPQGVGLLLPLLWEYWQALISGRERSVSFETGWQRVTIWWHSWLWGVARAARRWRNWPGLLWVCCVPLGICGFYTYAWIKTGDFFAELDTERWGWGRNLTPPWMTIWNALQHPVSFTITDWSAWPISMAAIAIFTILLLWMPKRLPGMYVVYAAVMIFLPLSTGRISSISRFYLVVFPVQILLAQWSRKERHGILYGAILTLCLIGQSLAMASFVLGFPFIA